MRKNVIIGILALLSLFFFFYGLTQQIKAENLAKIMVKAELESARQKEVMEAALKEEILQRKMAELQVTETQQIAEEALQKSKNKNK